MCPCFCAARITDKWVYPANQAKIAVIGLNVMGVAIAANLLRHGNTVCILDESGLSLVVAQNVMRELLRPYLEECALEGVLERFSVACNLQCLLSDRFWFVIEASEEELAFRQDVFRMVAAHFKKYGVEANRIVLCSANMSGVHTKYKARCIGLRLFDPALHIGDTAVMYLDRPPPPSFVAHVEGVLRSLQLTPSVQPKAHLRRRRVRWTEPVASEMPSGARLPP